MSCLSAHGTARLTRDPELFKTQQGGWLHFTIAAFRKTPKPGKQESDLFEVDYFLKNPESGLLKSLKKGRLIYLNRAELRNDKFIGKDGREKNAWKIMLFSFDFLDAPPKEEEKPVVKTKKLDAGNIRVPDFDNEEPPF